VNDPQSRIESSHERRRRLRKMRKVPFGKSFMKWLCVAVVAMFGFPLTLLTFNISLILGGGLFVFLPIMLVMFLIACLFWLNDHPRVMTAVVVVGSLSLLVGQLIVGGRAGPLTLSISFLAITAAVSIRLAESKPR
jgi:hypothetical protein